ncbi:hypothetical protein F441_16570 [Phytophthora nicotianae CJ01A1]|uniref:Uncharacterized protein n=2 Tax=Phytophthora nicotianae TaxID=4792 RepID=A0A0W8BP84_PHYNI|nr:hypothetical protein L915_16271 [Phytophthora nicotianae]ETP07120.1 hypothetical protein F441_16570 [Phytophthora nicotianae CJ01A1]KUF73661.1 hypothetical protein AM587_10013699 [Phytophthora nicotianae]KUF91905.1 hypothetical protein AM588_10006134 [Phytophthora nicotianae]
MDLSVDEDGYNSSTGSVDEDAELELSCALHDLTLRVKTFEANMQGRFRHGLEDDENEEEITEDIDHFEEEAGSHYYDRHRMDSDSASPKRRNTRRTRSDYKMAKPEQDHDDEDVDEIHSDEEVEQEAKGESDENLEEWDSQEEKEELCELKQNIAKLLQSMQEEAKALGGNQSDCNATN